MSRANLLIMRLKLLLFFIGVFITNMTIAQCDIISPDYLESFTTITPQCWDEANSGDATTGPGDLGSGSWVADEFLNTGSDDGAYKINLFNNSKSDWIISPQFDLTGGPFQVEFDFAITNWNSNTVAGTLGSDDLVQLLITNDDGVTWTPLLTYDNTSVVPISGIHPVVDLSTYADDTVQFGILASEGTENDPEDVDVFVDNFRVRGISSCIEPTDISATTVSSTSTEISWTEAGTSTSWNIEYGVEGFTQGTGIVIDDVTSTSFILTDLELNTSYEFYVQSVCGPDDESSWSIPFQFFNGYCNSTPSGNDGEGVANVTIGNTDFPSYGDETYEDHTAIVANIFQGINNNIIITFATGFTYNTNIWIDLNDDLEFDETELMFQGESSNSNPALLDASFNLPIDAALGEHRMRIGTADTGQATPNPCYSGTWGVTLDFAINIGQLNCEVPSAEYDVIADCDANQFNVEVDITDLGDAASLEISNDLNTNTVQATALGVYQIGPFDFGSTVTVFVTNEQDNNCAISSSPIGFLTCPPSNDTPCDATLLETQVDTSCNIFGSGTIFGATSSSNQNSNCADSADDDVWFQFTAMAESQVISIENVVGGAFNLDHGLYEGSCDSLTELYCSNDIYSIASQMIVGNTYYIRVFYGGNAETSTFDICLRDAPVNSICEDAVPFCSINGAITTPNTIGVPGNGGIACLATTPNPTWNAIQIGNSGSIEIEITQTEENGNGLDVDFVLWGPFTSIEEACSQIAFEDCPTCPNNSTNPNFYPFGNIVDCSYSSNFVENLTINDAQSGEVYMLLVTNFSGNPGNIKIEQTNAGEPGASDLTAEFEIALGPDINVCEDDQSIITLNASSTFANSFEWFYNGTLLDSGPDLNIIEVAISGVYSVIAYNEVCGVFAEDDIVVSFIDCDNAGIIAVSAFYDANNNTVFDAIETNFTNGYFTYEMNNDGMINTVESSTGSFTIPSFSETDTYDINYYLYDEYLDCYDVSIVSFEDVNVLFGEDVNVDFPIVNNQNCEDIGVYLINQQSPRPGFSHTNYLVIENLGIVTTSGTVDYNLDEDLNINSISSGANYTTTLTATGFSLDFIDLQPDQSIEVTISLQTPATVSLGELVTNTATYTTVENDIVLDNNTSSITEVVIGAYDPNNKMESHGKDIVYDDFIISDEYLYYTIRFQNLGTADAINVRIEDVLNTQLDETTFQMLRSSHNYVVTRTERNLEWSFENINLPAELDDAEGSNGYVYFKIKPKSGYAIGDIIPNSASIFFDFNAPIVTNIFETHFVVESLSTPEVESIVFKMYPNPAKESVTIELNSNSYENTMLTVFDIQGKQILKQLYGESNLIQLDVSGLQNGLYFVQLSNSSYKQVEKMVIE